MGNTISNLTSKCIPEYGNDDEILSEEKPSQQQQQQQMEVPQNIPKPQEKPIESDGAIFKVTSQESASSSSAIVEESYGMAPIQTMQRHTDDQKNKDADEDDIFKDMEPEIKKPFTIQTQKSLPQTSDRLRFEITQEDQEDTSAWD